jgi:hypothetical protein
MRSDSGSACNSLIILEAVDLHIPALLGEVAYRVISFTVSLPTENDPKIIPILMLESKCFVSSLNTLFQLLLEK